MTIRNIRKRQNRFAAVHTLLRLLRFYSAFLRYVRALSVCPKGRFYFAALFFKKIAHGYAENFGQPVKLNVGNCPRAVLDAGNRTAADIHRNCLKLVRKPLLTHFPGNAELPHLVSDHVFSLTVNYSRHAIFSFEVFVFCLDIGQLL